MVVCGSSTNGERERGGMQRRVSGGGDLECLSMGRAEGTDRSHTICQEGIYGLASGLGLS